MSRAPARALAASVLRSMVAASLVAAAASAQEPPAATPPAPAPADRVPVLAYYYLDHEREGWPGTDTPLLGYYSSADPDVLRQHVRWAKQAGIDGFLVSWSRSGSLDRRLRILAEVAAAEDFRLGILLDARRRSTKSVDRAAADLDHFVRSFAELAAFQILAKPLVVWNGTADYSREEVARVAGTRRSRLLLLASERTVEGYRRIADLVDGNAYYWSSADPLAPTYAERIGALGREVAARRGLWIAPAAPGYQRASGERAVDRRSGETLRRALTAASATGADFVGLISWNDFADGTHVEPSRRHGTRSLETLALLRGGILPGPRQDEARSVPVLAFYYIWFDPRSWQRGKTDYPLLGPYSSDDPEVMRLHVRWAKQAGIDGFIVSWKVDDDLDPRLAQLVEIARAESFKLAIIYQGLDFERRPRPLDTVLRDFDQFLERYASDPVFSVFDRPVVIWNGTWEYSRDDIARVTAGRRDRLAILAAEKTVANYVRIADLVDGDAYYWSSGDPDTTPGYREKLSEMGSEVHARGGLWIAPASPGYDARLIGGVQIVDRRDGRTLRDSALAAMLSGPDAVGLISWNEFSENTHVEPSQQLGTRYLEVVADLRGGAAPSLDFESLSVEPGTVEIQTVPPLQGIRFRLDDRDLVSDAAGVIRLPMTRPGVHRLEVLPPEPAEQRIRFAGWESPDAGAVREIVVPLRSVIEAGFEIHHQAQPLFVGEDGESIDPARVSSMLLKDTQGRRVPFRPGEPLWLPANALVRRMSGLQSVDLEYRVERVEVGGSNVVNTGQQRLRADAPDRWRIRLLVHRVRFTARDAVFRFPVGTGVTLSFPDGRHEELRFEGDQRRAERTLPRGELEVRALGAHGVALPVPVVLSRAQDVVAPVLTWWSLLALGLGAVVLAGGLLTIGRPRWRAALGGALSREKRWYRRRSPDSAGG